MKKIIHVDMDCFYAQVEMRDNPALRNVPLAVGGLPGTRSVLCTSNYLARKFGVKAALPTDFAMKLCPQLVVVVPNFTKYKEASLLVQNIFSEYSQKVEPVSLDEAYIDVSNDPHATLLAREIKEKIYKATNLTSSVGLAPNKFLSKIASDWKKPDALFVIKPNEVENFVRNLDVKVIPGIGPRGLENLKSINISTCKDIREIDFNILLNKMGKFSYDLVNYAHGIDHREVISEYERKTLSVETTFLKDYNWSLELENYFQSVFDELNIRLITFLEDEGERKIKKIFAKVRFSDFTRTSCEMMIQYNQEFNLLKFKESLLILLKNNLKKKELPVRLIGLGVRFEDNDEQNSKTIQLPLFSC